MHLLHLPQELQIVFIGLQVKFGQIKTVLLELVNDLEFIKNKKNYGLDMLTGVVKISQNDFNYIIKNDYK